MPVFVAGFSKVFNNPRETFLKVCLSGIFKVDTFEEPNSLEFEIPRFIKPYFSKKEYIL